MHRGGVAWQDEDYPPSERRLTLYYDAVKQRARIDVHAGFDAGSCRVY